MNMRCDIAQQLDCYKYAGCSIPLTGCAAAAPELHRLNAIGGVIGCVSDGGRCDL